MKCYCKNHNILIDIGKFKRCVKCGYCETYAEMKCRECFENISNCEVDCKKMLDLVKHYLRKKKLNRILE